MLSFKRKHNKRHEQHDHYSQIAKKLGAIVLMGIISANVSAAVYKVTDAEGGVIFTDRPQNYIDDPNVTVEPMSVYSGNTNTAQTSNNTSSSSSNSTAQSSSTNRSTATSSTHTNTQNSTINYQLSIEEPAEEQAYRKPAQEISVSVNVSPELQNGDSVVIMVDGSQYATGTSTVIPTIDLLPGEHTLTVNVINSNNEVQVSESMHFYIIQNTNALQQRRQLAEQLQAYHDLPWYQKIYLQLRQDELVPKPNPNVNGQPSSSITGTQVSASMSQGGVSSSF